MPPGQSPSFVLHVSTHVESELIHHDWRRTVPVETASHLAELSCDTNRFECVWLELVIAMLRLLWLVSGMLLIMLWSALLLDVSIINVDKWLIYIDLACQYGHQIRDHTQVRKLQYTCAISINAVVKLNQRMNVVWRYFEQNQAYNEVLPKRTFQKSSLQLVNTLELVCWKGVSNNFLPKWKELCCESESYRLRNRFRLVTQIFQ